MDSGIVHDWTKGQSSTSVKTTGATQSSSSRFQLKGEQGQIWSGGTMVADLRLEPAKRAEKPTGTRAVHLLRAKTVGLPAQLPSAAANVIWRARHDSTKKQNLGNENLIFYFMKETMTSMACFGCSSMIQ